MSNFGGGGGNFIQIPSSAPFPFVDIPAFLPRGNTTNFTSSGNFNFGPGVFDYFNNLGTTNELESAINAVLQGQQVGGLQIPNELKNDAAVIGAGLLAADESEGGEITEQTTRKKRRRIRRARCGRTGKRSTDLRDRIKAGGV
jgi:hypothetical protein